MTAVIATDDLDLRLEEALIGRPMPSGKSCLGIEMERLILHRETRESAPLDFCRQLLADLAADIGGVSHFDGEVLNRVEGDGYSFTMEPGGQLELAVDPRTCLAEIDPTMTQIRDLVNRRLAGTPYELSPLGHAPVSLPDEIGLLPRSRYVIMDRAMTPRGRLTRNMMRATAGFQLAYDFADRQDAGRKLALLNRLAPLMVAITANSRMVGGVDSGFASYRHYVWLHTDRERVGIPEGGLRADTAVDGYMRFARRATMLFLRRGGELVPAPDKSLEDVVAEQQVTQEDLELHLSALFPFVRLRNYLEVRYLDSVDWQLARSVLALLSGLIYCPHATARAESLSESLLPGSPEDLHALHLDAAKHALEARDAHGVRFADLALQALEISRATLGGDACGWAEPGDLAAVEARIRG